MDTLRKEIENRITEYHAERIDRAIIEEDKEIAISEALSSKKITKQQLDDFNKSAQEQIEIQTGMHIEGSYV